jgi:hypothetical protein
MDISKNATGEAQFLQKACDGHQAREYQVLPLSSVADAGGNASDRQLVPNICTKRKVRKSNYSCKEGVKFWKEKKKKPICENTWCREASLHFFNLDARMLCHFKKSIIPTYYRVSSLEK